MSMARFPTPELEGRPDATLSHPPCHANVHILKQTPQLLALLTMIRDR